MKQIGIFDESNRLRKLSTLGDPLERLNRAIDWSLFEAGLNRVFIKEHKGAGGRPPYSYLMLFKILVLQRLYNVSDDQAECQINDRVSIMQFPALYADSAYSGKPIAEQRPEGIENRIHEKWYRNKPLTLEQKEHNRVKSRIRVRGQHVFGFMTGTMRGITIRSIGMMRAAFNIGLANLVYNLCRAETLSRILPAAG